MPGILQISILLIAGLHGATAFAGGVGNLRPAWIESYQVWSGRAGLGDSNLSYLQDRAVRGSNGVLTDQFDTLIDRNRANQLRQAYDDINREYEQKQRAGLSNPTLEQAHLGAVSGFSNSVVDEIEQKKLRKAGDDAAHIIDKDETAKAIMAPGAVVAGVYVGRSVRLRVTDESNFIFRTSLRDRTGQIELHSPILYGSFEYHPMAADYYSLAYPIGVDFGKMLDFNHLVDFQAEKYQFRLMRSLPVVNLNSSVLYGSSSNVVASSLAKQLTPHLAAVVDSLYYLTPYDPTHSLEERVRLRYDFHF